MAHPGKPTPMGLKLMGLLRQVVADDAGQGLAAISHRLPVETPGWAAPRTYTVFLEPDDKGMFLVRCRELPGVVAFGENEEEALAEAEEAIREAVGAPRPSPDFPY
jgi:predicted RNase H-like HicB family nuclease